VAGELKLKKKSARQLFREILRLHVSLELFECYATTARDEISSCPEYRLKIELVDMNGKLFP
jgi:hypothetical protein